ncbi:tyrosine-protein phosphatase [Jeotgalicoccus halotolerans]|uniref:Tyrosine-protein phosphatase n=1 Tax=Jeotgalicoccus halotolerans TaxID=157227 RepID=A0A3E0B1L2_9STAP|nr:CpsB/CapC family capsule biosynthesis tyrosine phosphatase [Jeotgalicoccus halotolerans]REG25859.1 protein-tyrosine phosphatase [Jeotgalicoccus halotolerans]
MIDIHNHLLINVDDGPKSEEETLDLLKQAVDESITDIICTPHHHSGTYNTPADVVKEKLSEVKNIIDKHQLPVKVHPGQEIRINDDLIDELRTGEALTLAGSKYILIEFSFTELREDVDEVFTALRELGLTPIIAHPERCRPLVKNEQILARLIKEGALAQVTAASVCGEFGSDLQENSLELIQKGLIQIVASDAHHAEYRPFMSKEAFEIIENELGKSYVEKMKQTAAGVLYNQ